LCGATAHAPSGAVCVKASAIGDDMVEVVGPHPLTDLLRQVNSQSNGFDLIAMTAMNLDAYGDAYWALAVNTVLGVPSQVWQMQPQHVEVVPGHDRIIEGYMLGRMKGSGLELPPEEVVHFMGPRITGMYYGDGKLWAAWNIIQQSHAMHEMDYATFANHARPDYLVIAEDADDAAQMKAFSTELEAKLRGTRRSGRFAVVSGKVDIKPMQWPPKDVSGRDDIVNEIAAVCGVPIGMLLANDPNRANAEAQHYSWNKNTIMPLLCRLEQTLNERLVPYYDDADSLMLAFDDPVPEDWERKIREAEARLRLPISTPNEIRSEVFGDDPIDDPRANELQFAQQPLAFSAAPVGATNGSTAAPERGQPQQQAGQPIPGEVVADTALNGAQVTALLELVRAATSGEVEVAAARIMATIAFPSIDAAQIGAMFGAVKPRGFVGPTALPKPDELKPDGKALLAIAAMVDEHNTKHGVRVSLVDAVTAYTEGV